MAKTDLRFDPKTNDYFARLLQQESFDYMGLKPKTFTHPVTNDRVGVTLSRNGERSLVLVLLPEMGTGVAYHDGRLSGLVRYIGSIVEEGTSPLLAHKYQNDLSALRGEGGHDIVLKHKRFECFDTRGKGVCRGYHNISTTDPIALVIRNLE